MIFPMNKVVDCSFWQETIDYSKMKDLADGIIFRAGQGTRKDNRVAPKRQAENWWNTLGDVDFNTMRMQTDK